MGASLQETIKLCGVLCLACTLSALAGYAIAKSGERDVGAVRTPRLLAQTIASKQTTKVKLIARNRFKSDGKLDGLAQHAGGEWHWDAKGKTYVPGIMRFATKGETGAKALWSQGNDQVRCASAPLLQSIC